MPVTCVHLTLCIGWKDSTVYQNGQKNINFCVRELPSQLRVTLLYSVLYEHLKSNKHINNLSFYLKYLEVWMIGLKDVVSSRGQAECLCQSEKLKTDISIAPYTSALQQHMNSKETFFRESKFLQNFKVIKKGKEILGFLAWGKISTFKEDPLESAKWVGSCQKPMLAYCSFRHVIDDGKCWDGELLLKLKS